MALANAIKNAKRPSQLITWVDQDGTALDLTGAVITARIDKEGNAPSVSSDGAFVITDAVNGVFRWDYGTVDVSESGNHIIQFNAAFGSNPTPAKSFTEPWQVNEEI